MPVLGEPRFDAARLPARQRSPVRLPAAVGVGSASAKTIGDHSKCLLDVHGEPVLPLPSDWAGLPLYLFPIPGYAIIGAARSVSPMILCAIDGYGDRFYRADGEVLSLRTEPGMLEIYGTDFSWEEAVWCGAPGVCVALDFSAEAVTKVLKRPVALDFATAHEVVDSRLSWLIMELVAQARLGKAANQPYVESISTSLIWLASREYAPEKTAGSCAPEQFSPDAKRRLDQYLAGNLGRVVSLDEMAECVFLSKFHFARRFSATFGLSPHRYLLRLRMLKAQQLLRERQLSIGAIANSVGFGSQAAFATAFRNFFGSTPSEARLR